mmetsp:Transcript_8705/g.14453  ORF Transcript_8705/g.14453 Transcript_8705/m.14453 type:complete len:260 (+) Transcript_8705:680-1459(+)
MSSSSNAEDLPPDVHQEEFISDDEIAVDVKKMKQVMGNVHMELLTLAQGQQTIMALLNKIPAIHDDEPQYTPETRPAAAFQPTLTTYGGGAGQSSSSSSSSSSRAASASVTTTTIASSMLRDTKFQPKKQSKKQEEAFTCYISVIIDIDNTHNDQVYLLKDISKEEMVTVEVCIKSDASSTVNEKVMSILRRSSNGEVAANVDNPKYDWDYLKATGTGAKVSIQKVPTVLPSPSTVGIDTPDEICCCYYFFSGVESFLR